MPPACQGSSSVELLRRFASTLHDLRVCRTHRIAVALSGGSDSMALALLASWWKDGLGALTPAALLNLVPPPFSFPPS